MRFHKVECNDATCNDAVTVFQEDLPSPAVCCMNSQQGAGTPLIRGHNIQWKNKTAHLRRKNTMIK